MPRKRSRDGRSTTRPPPLIPGSRSAGSAAAGAGPPEVPSDEPPPDGRTRADAGAAPQATPGTQKAGATSRDPNPAAPAPPTTSPESDSVPAVTEEPGPATTSEPDPVAAGPTPAMAPVQTQGADPEPAAGRPESPGPETPGPVAVAGPLTADPVTADPVTADPEPGGTALPMPSRASTPLPPSQVAGAQTVHADPNPAPAAPTVVSGIEAEAQIEAGAIASTAVSPPVAEGRAPAPEPVPPVGAAPARLIPGSALIGVVVGLWAVAPSFTGPGLVLQDPSVEIIDHVVPGLLVVAASVAALVVAWSAARPWPVLFLGGAVVAAAGLWMVATHVPLLLQAVQGEAPWSATLFHLAPSVAVLWLGLAWTARYWSAWVDPPA